MSHVLSSDEIALVEQLTLKAYSAREIRRMTGIGMNTIVKYQRAMTVPLVCECGQPLKPHRGWCKFRYARSAARQAFIAGWRGVAKEHEPAPDTSYFGRTQ